VNKFDLSHPTCWVIQMEHYFSLHDNTDDLTKLHHNVLYLDPESCNGGNGVKTHAKGMFLKHSLFFIFMNSLTPTQTIWVV
jgi:hypothetical protein